MTDAHCHVPGTDPSVRELLIGRDFIGVHPWDCADFDEDAFCRALADHPQAGVGEIGLDRLKDRMISPQMRRAFERQLDHALESGRPVVLHGAKCWGQVVSAVTARTRQAGQTFLFHGFSRSDGLIPQIVALGGYLSVGPAVLNDHAVNYRELVRKIPAERLLLETDRTVESAEKCPSLREILEKTAELRGSSADELERVTDLNAQAFLNRQIGSENR